ncbi:hypothetical protein HYV79_00110 [Candidatus Woesearchaeota archaeon]|nr:hypothetical protein [Candidatus Woesearchaeota archaeon]
MRWIIFAILLLTCITSAYSAIVQGRIYDIELTPQEGVVVEIFPERQVYVSQDGIYSFTVNEGTYILQATKKPDLKIEEQIIVKQKENYTIDLILLPDISEETYLLQETGVSLEKEEKQKISYWWLTILVLFILSIIFFIKKKRKQEVKQKSDNYQPQVLTEIKPPADKLEQIIISFIKKEGGRTSQKDLRKNIPYSEAKISLVITQLESEGKIKKIKKGRGNIIVLN